MSSKWVEAATKKSGRHGGHKSGSLRNISQGSPKHSMAQGHGEPDADDMNQDAGSKPVKGKKKSIVAAMNEPMMY